MKQTIDRLTVVALLVLTSVLICVACAGSGGCGSNPPKPIADVVDCTKQDSAQIVAAEAQCAGKIPDWGAVEACAIAEIPALGWQIGGCVLADLAQQYLTSKKAATDVEQSNAARRAVDDYRKQYAHGAAFHFEGADL